MRQHISRALTFLFLTTTPVVSAQGDIEESPAQPASFTDPDLASYRLAEPRCVEGISTCAVVENTLGLEDSAEVALRGSCHGSFVWPKTWYNDDLGLVPEPKMWQTGCHRFGLASRQVIERSLDGETVTWPFVYHLRMVYRLDGSPLSCDDPSRKLSFGWPEGIDLENKSFDEKVLANRGDGEVFIPKLYPGDISHGYESTSGAVMSVFAGLWDQQTPVIVLDVHWNQTLFSFNRVWGMPSEDGPREVFRLLTGPLSAPPTDGSVVVENKLSTCPSSVGCQPAFLFGTASVHWQGLQPRPTF